MSIVKEYEEGWIVSHNDYINRVYRGKHKLRPSLFNIKHPYKIDKNHKKTVVKLDQQVVDIKNKFNALLKLARIDSILNSVSNNEVPNNNDALIIAESCTIDTKMLQNMSNIIGGNTSPDLVYHKVKNCDLLIPEMCRFICGDVRNTISRIEDSDFDFVILDPPWWNKYIRRKKSKNTVCGYQMLYNEDVANLPLGKLLADDALVAVWCTNANIHENDIKNKMFPNWGIAYAATWFWVKVTEQGEPVCPFNKTKGKQPFERILLGVKDGNRSSIPEGKIFISVPSALHSHKPPLNDLLRQYISKENPKCLEIFARYLLPDTTSVGLEPLRWQHRSLYTDEDNEKV